MKVGLGQVLEVERLELDHFWEIHRQQLEQRDQEIAMLREQLRLRNSHIQQQRELDEKIEKAFRSKSFALK